MTSAGSSVVVVAAIVVVVGAALVVGAAVVVVAVLAVAVVVVVAAAVVGVGLVAELLLQAATSRLAAVEMRMLRARITRASWQRHRGTVGSCDVFGLTDADPARYRCGALSREWRRGDVAEWFRQGPAKPCIRVRFPASPPAPDQVQCLLTGFFSSHPTSTEDRSKPLKTVRTRVSLHPHVRGRRCR